MVPTQERGNHMKIKNDVGVTGPRSAAPGRTGTAGGGREFLWFPRSPVGTVFKMLCVTKTQSVLQCVPTQERGNNMI